MEIREMKDKIVSWLQKEVKNAGAEGIVFGLSGGIDSAVVAALAKEAFGENILGVIMPCHSNVEDEEHAKLLAQEMHIPIAKVDLTKTFDSLVEASNLPIEHQMAKSNVKPRLRMTTLYYFAQSKNYLVCGTSNKSEYTIGYFTKYGDSGSDLLPIIDLVKKEVRELARFLNVPSVIIEKAPSAGLWKGQTDEDEMGFSYELLDAYIEGKEIPAETKERIDRLYQRSEHKRRFANRCEIK